MSPQENAGDGSAALRLALFATFLSLLLTVAMLVLRSGLPTPLGVVAVGPAILGFATLGPTLWAQRRGGLQLWLGPLAALALIIGCGVAALGIVGHVLLWIAFIGVLVGTVGALRSGTTPGGRVLLWIALLLGAAFLAILIANGTKYVNFISDQLELYGRADGDVIFHGAIANAIRYFGFPSTGIDGLNLLRYHSGVDALSALIAGGGGIDAVLALIILQTSVLIPLAVFAFGWSAGAFGRYLLPNLTLGALGLATAAVVTVLLIQNGFLGILILANTPMLLSGLLLVLMAPPIVISLIERREGAVLALVVAAIALPFLTVAKVTTGLIWAALVGYLVLRLIGPKRGTFWVVGVAMVVLFAGSYWLSNDPGAAGAVLFGTPFYVEYGFKSGNYLLPLTVHLTLLIVAIALFRLRHTAPQCRMLVETLLVVAVAANLPGLVLYIPGGDAVFFLSTLNWLVAPLLAMLLTAFPAALRKAQTRVRPIAMGLSGLALVGILVDVGIRVDDRFFTAISGAALVHTGDLTYYADDRRRIWRNDTRRALAEHGLIGLYRLPPPVPPGAGLAQALIAAKQRDGRVAAYIPPQSDYWTLVKDCDGRSLWPMAVAGVPLIDGYVPIQAECRQEFALAGYGAPPEVRAPLAEPELCRRALAAGLPVVLQVESLEDRSKDRLTVCR